MRNKPRQPCRTTLVKRRKQPARFTQRPHKRKPVLTPPAPKTLRLARPDTAPQQHAGQAPCRTLYPARTQRAITQRPRPEHSTRPAPLTRRTATPLPRAPQRRQTPPPTYHKIPHAPLKRLPHIDTRARKTTQTPRQPKSPTDYPIYPTRYSLETPSEKSLNLFIITRKKHFFL